MRVRVLTGKKVTFIEDLCLDSARPAVDRNATDHYDSIDSQKYAFVILTTIDNYELLLNSETLRAEQSYLLSISISNFKVKLI